MIINLMQLPLDVLINILKHLHLNDLRNLMLTCKGLRSLILNNNTIWRNICYKKLIVYNSSRNRTSAQISCYNLTRISQNWCKGIYRSKKIIHHHTNYMPWLKYHHSEALVLTVGSQLHCYPVDKNAIPICNNALWTLDVPKVKRYDVRTSDISRFIIKDNLIVCGIRDGCVAVYSVNDIHCKPGLLSHIENCHNGGQAEVSAVEYIQTTSTSYILSGSSDSPSLRLYHWSPEGCDSVAALNCNKNYDSINVPIYEDAGIRCIGVNTKQDKVAIGLNGNSKPLLLDVNTCNFLMNADDSRNVKRAVRDIQWHSENTIVYVTHSGALQIIDTRSYEIVYDALDPFQSTLYSVRTDCNHAILVGSSEYSRCVLYDSRVSRRHVQLYFTQKSQSSPVYSLDFDSTKLIAAVDRGVSVLNFNVNSAAAQRRDYSDVFEYCQA